MRILGIDPSLTNYGWCVVDTENGIEVRVLARGRFQTPASMEFIDRYIGLRDSLSSLIQEWRPDHMGQEYPIFNDLYSEGMYGLFLFSCEAVKKEKQDVVFFSPGQVKSHAHDFLVHRGDRPKKWKMEKPDMVEAAQKASKGGRWNHNEADAFWVAKAASRFWLLYSEQLDPEDLTQVEREQFLKIHKFKRGKNAGKTVKKGILHKEDNRFFVWSQRKT